MQFLIRVCLQALAFMYLIPMIGGIEFHGNFLHAAALAIFFGVMLWIADLLAVALSAYLTITTFGVALLFLIPAWLLGFWILPAVALKWVADFMPGFLSVHGWVPAIIAGLVMMVISMFTGSLSTFSSDRYNRQTSAV